MVCDSQTRHNGRFRPRETSTPHRLNPALGDVDTKQSP
ncbi:hypothetical protein HSB1_25110 [Halogranum salarium B-1]|uniref:Uncharacterized protein n=1 Tax=Halogranum salarium B-1 TaxID=1210908 RepID=J2ZEJ0_9EURY|nr:hypothetical protein HSB1_25110 [Halogranum salarium B-1]